jgi:hypothetical protein
VISMAELAAILLFTGATNEDVLQGHVRRWLQLKSTTYMLQTEFMGTMDINSPYLYVSKY